MNADKNAARLYAAQLALRAMSFDNYMGRQALILEIAFLSGKV